MNQQPNTSPASLANVPTLEDPEALGLLEDRLNQEVDIMYRYEQGASTVKVASDLGLKPHQVRSVLVKHHVPSHPVGRPPTKN